jgi:hypothetical protein
MAERFYQLWARFEDRLKVFGFGFEQEARSHSRERSTRRRTSQKRNLTVGVPRSKPPHLQYAAVLDLACDLNNA